MNIMKRRHLKPLISKRLVKLHLRNSVMYLRNVEYSILLVMSELSTVPCDHALGLWIAGTRASSVDGELPWRAAGTGAHVGR